MATAQFDSDGRYRVKVTVEEGGFFSIEARGTVRPGGRGAGTEVPSVRVRVDLPRAGVGAIAESVDSRPGVWRSTEEDAHGVSEPLSPRCSHGNGSQPGTPQQEQQQEQQKAQQQQEQQQEQQQKHVQTQQQEYTLLKQQDQEQTHQAQQEQPQHQAHDDCQERPHQQQRQQQACPQEHQQQQPLQEQPTQQEQPHNGRDRLEEALRSLASAVEVVGAQFANPRPKKMPRPRPPLLVPKHCFPRPAVLPRSISLVLSKPPPLGTPGIEQVDPGDKAPATEGGIDEQGGKRLRLA